MGAEPVKIGKGRRSRRKLSSGLVVLAIALGLFAYFSYRPVVRLRPEPPKGFVDTHKGWDSKRQAAEERVARAYWEVTVEKVQLKYSFGTALPDNPPPEFSIEDKDFPGGGFEKSSATRARYWQKVRGVWVLPQTWERSYRWSLMWFYDGLASFQQAVWRNIDGILRRFRT
jgi:hypothetical protein